MPMTPGYYIPTMYGNAYYPSQNQASLPAQSYSPAPQQQTSQGIIWVDGEVGAKAFQIPQGWPAGSPIALWDTNDTVIYLKSINQMGMPNPLQKIHYTMEEQRALPQGGISGTGVVEESKYVTKDDLSAMKDEIIAMLKNQNQNRNNNQQNRGGNT